MRKHQKKLLIAAAAAAVMVALPTLANHTWGNASGTYHWDATSLPVQISVIDSVTSSWQSELDTTISQWNVSSSLNLTITSSDSSAATRSACAIANGQIRACNDAYGNTGWSGLASLNIDSSNHILYGVAKVNETYSMSQEDRNKVMCQEVGHLFGLGHTSEDGSSQNTCMDYATNPVNSQWPNAHDYELLDTIYAHIGGGGGGGGGGGSNELSNGVAVTGLSASTGNDVVYTMVVPSGASAISFDMTGGTGDADMYVKFGSTPTDSSYDCRPYKSGNNETCAGTQTGGTYYVRVKAYSSFSGVSLTGNYTSGGGGGGGGTSCTPGNGVLCNGVVEGNMSGSRSSETNFYIDVPAGASNLSFKMNGGSGDADMYVKYASAPTTSSYDCRPYKNGNNETCNETANQGRYHVMIRGYSAYSGTDLTVTYTGGTPNAASHASGHYTQGVMIEVGPHHEVWMTKNADDTITLTQVILATQEQLEEVESE